MYPLPAPSKATRALAGELRDRLLPDLLAASMVLRAAGNRFDDGADRVVHAVADQLESDINEIRSLIAGLSGRQRT